jgi:putative heme-binding domain-containing protein
MKEVTRLLNRLSAAAALVLVFSCSPLVFGQRAPFPIPDPDPEIERKSFVVADGFEVNLFAADPLIAKPLQMNFDPAGRLWIASSEVYPQITPGAVADDKVLIVEDRDHDGRADSTTVFARGLLIPTGIEPGDGGAYVANSTELLHFKDTDGDGKADATRVVLSGFGTEDTHHILHTLRWGFDGMLYFNQSIYIHSHIETPHGVRRLGGGGIWQFRPETMELDVFIRGLVNPWGHHFDRWGQSFATDGAGGEGINYCLPGAYYTTAPDAVRILKGLNPGSPKYCGLEVASGRHLPESWRGSLLTNDFRGNRVCRFVVADDGAGYAAREQVELIKSKHVAFRPIDIKMGPDGAIYIADWYNPIIQHGEVDFRDPRRDHTRGRIWRVTAKGRPLVARPRLVGASIDELLEHLKAPEDWTRAQAKRVLKERGTAEVISKLANWVKRLDAQDPEHEHHRLEALWTYQALDVAEPALLSALSSSNDPRVRAAATRVVPFWRTRVADPRSLLAARVTDEQPRVRLEAVRSLAKIGGAVSADVALEALDRPIDTFLEYALWLTARQLAPNWMPEVQAGRFDFSGHPRRLIFALRAVDSPAIVKPLLALLGKGDVPGDLDETVQTLIARLGEPADLAVVLDQVIKGKAMPAPRRVLLLNTLVRATRDRKVVPAGDLARVGTLLATNEEAFRETAVRAIGTWKVATLQNKLVELLAAADTSRGVRAAAIEALIRNGGADGRRAVESLTERGAPEVQARVLAALLEADARGTTPRAVTWLGRLEPNQYGAAAIVLARVLELRGASAILASALGQGSPTLSPDLAKLCVRQVRASGRDEPGLIAALEKAGRLKEGAKKLSDKEMNHLLGDVARFGDPARGEAIYRRKEINCQKCHAIAGAGGQVGPGLESIGASAQPDYLVDSLLEPGKAVKENYHALVVATSDGKIYTGIKLRQTDSELILRDAEDREVAIPTSSIEEQKTAGSLMPAGLTETLTRAELIDLVRFLSQLGKIGPFSVGTDRVLRRWQVLEATPAVNSAMSQHHIEALFAKEQSLNWRPAYTTVAGELPLSEWRDPGRAADRVPVAVARGQLEVTTPGKVKLTFNAADALSVWVDGRRVAPAGDSPSSMILDLTRGVHTIAVLVDLAHRREGIRCVLEDIAGSPARAQAVLGK